MIVHVAVCNQSCYSQLVAYPLNCPTELLDTQANMYLPVLVQTACISFLNKPLHQDATDAKLKQ